MITTMSLYLVINKLANLAAKTTNTAPSIPCDAVNYTCIFLSITMLSIITVVFNWSSKISRVQYCKGIRAVNRESKWNQQNHYKGQDDKEMNFIRNSAMFSIQQVILGCGMMFFIYVVRTLQYPQSASALISDFLYFPGSLCVPGFVILNWIMRGARGSKANISIDNLSLMWRRKPIFSQENKSPSQRIISLYCSCIAICTI